MRNVRLLGLNIGTTKKAIGTTYASKFLRFGLRFEDLINEQEFMHKYEEFYRFCKEIFGVEVDTTEELEKLSVMK